MSLFHLNYPGWPGGFRNRLMEEGRNSTRKRPGLSSSLGKLPGRAGFVTELEYLQLLRDAGTIFRGKAAAIACEERIVWTPQNPRFGLYCNFSPRTCRMGTQFFIPIYFTHTFSHSRRSPAFSIMWRFANPRRKLVVVWLAYSLVVFLADLRLEHGDIMNMGGFGGAGRSWGWQSEPHCVEVLLIIPLSLAGCY